MYELSTHHIVLLFLGLGIIAAYWIPRFLSGREPAASALLIAAGVISTLVVPDLPQIVDPTIHSVWWEHASEIAIVVVLFGTGLRIDRLVSTRQWLPTVYLLIIGMPLCILLVAILGQALAGMTLAGAILLGAVLAPTDPVLAGDVQVGPPHEGGGHPVRLTLTAEAGLNDGLAFPFAHLALLIGAFALVSPEQLAQWACPGSTPLRQNRFN